KDYDVLVGTNRHTITPTGWVQEEQNLKVVLDEAGRPIASEPVLAEELGLNRYERLDDFDDAAARRYWERTQAFWNQVRVACADIAATHPASRLRAAPDQGRLFTPLFEYADRLADGEPYDAQTARAFARETVQGYLVAGSPSRDGGY